MNRPAAVPRGCHHRGAALNLALIRRDLLTDGHQRADDVGLLDIGNAYRQHPKCPRVVVSNAALDKLKTLNDRPPAVRIERNNNVGTWVYRDQIGPAGVMDTRLMRAPADGTAWLLKFPVATTGSTRATPAVA